jgi:hypothetical protein
MSEKLVYVKVRLHIPGARVGDVIGVSEERAQKLVNARYASYTDEQAEQGAATVAVLQPTALAYASTVDSPVTELPNVSDLKAAWITAAEAIGVDVAREDGSAKNKEELVADVTAAVGGADGGESTS